MFLVLRPCISLAVRITKRRQRKSPARRAPQLPQTFSWVAESSMTLLDLHVHVLAFLRTIETLAVLANQLLLFQTQQRCFHVITRHSLQLFVWNPRPRHNLRWAVSSNEIVETRSLALCST
jgi:hypothetical protein